MIRASTAIALLILGAVLADWAWELERREAYGYANGQPDPGGSYSGGNNYYYYNSYHPGWFSRWFWYGNYPGYGYRSRGNIYIDNRTYGASPVPSGGGYSGGGYSGGSGSYSHVSSPASSGITRGGFGATGHSMGAGAHS